MANRDYGFYWVLLNGKWQVAEFADRYWFIIGSDDVLVNDSDFEEIGDRVLREPKVESCAANICPDCGREAHIQVYCQICDNDE